MTMHCACNNEDRDCSYPKCHTGKRDAEKEAPPEIAIDHITLRDYFAAAAMQGLVARGCLAGNDRPTLAADSAALNAYAMADAMLRAREA